MKKVLISASVVRKHIMEFHIPYLKWFKDHGYETYVASSNDYDNKEDCKIPYCDHFIDVPFSRNPFSKDNIVAYKMISNLLEKEKFTLIHTHTPVGGVITRIASKNARKKGTKVLYTAHGFHFFRGAPLINWILYYPIEKYCSKFTDGLITINSEDYNLAKNHFKAKKTYLVHGVGVSFEGRKRNNSSIREELGIESSDYVMCSIGELIKRKNHLLILRIIRENKDFFNGKKYLIVGDGKLLDSYRKFIEDNGLSHIVKLLGYRNDIEDILNDSNCFLFPSIQEGLPVSLMEAMNCELPCITSDTRGCRDLMTGVSSECICGSKEEWLSEIKDLCNDKNKSFSLGCWNRKVSGEYLIESVIKEYEAIYTEIFKV